MSHHLAYSMTAICSIGGVMAYTNAKSKVSLMAGVGIGTLFAVSGFLIQNNKDFGIELAAGTSMLLTVAMGRRAFKTRKAIPIGLGVTGAVSTAYYGNKLRQQYYGV